MKKEFDKETHDLIYSLGWVVHSFNHLESIVAMSVALLINPSDPQIGRIVTAGKAFSTLVELFGALCAHQLNLKKNSYIEKRVSAIIKRLIEINEQRNKMVHSRFLYVVEEKSFQRFKSSIKSIKGLKQDEITTNSKDVLNLSIEIERLCSEFEGFVRQEIVPITLKPIWINKEDDVWTMWASWHIMFSSSV